MQVDADFASYDMPAYIVAVGKWSAQAFLDRHNSRLFRPSMFR